MVLTTEQINTAGEEAVKAAGDYCKLKSISAGLTGKQHAGAMVHALCDAGLLAEEHKMHAFAILAELENGSALRQKLEKASILNANKIAASIADYV